MWGFFVHDREKYIGHWNIIGTGISKNHLGFTKFMIMSQKALFERYVVSFFYCLIYTDTNILYVISEVNEYQLTKSVRLYFKL